MDALTFNDQFNSRSVISCFVGGCQHIHAFIVIGQIGESEAQSIATEISHYIGKGGCQRVSWYVDATIQVYEVPLDVLGLHLWRGS